MRWWAGSLEFSKTGSEEIEAASLEIGKLVNMMLPEQNRRKDHAELRSVVGAWNHVAIFCHFPEPSLRT